MGALRNADTDLRFIGRGGPQMKAVAGETSRTGSNNPRARVVEVIKHYGYFRKQFHEALRRDRKEQTRRGRVDRLSGVQFASARALRKHAPSQKSFITSAPKFGPGTAAASKRWRPGSI